MFRSHLDLKELNLFPDRKFLSMKPLELKWRHPADTLMPVLYDRGTLPCDGKSWLLRTGRGTNERINGQCRHGWRSDYRGFRLGGGEIHRWWRYALEFVSVLNFYSRLILFLCLWRFSESSEDENGGNDMEEGIFLWSFRILKSQVRKFIVFSKWRRLEWCQGSVRRRRRWWCSPRLHWPHRCAELC